MASLSLHSDVHCSDLSHDWAIAYSDVTLIKVRHVMKPIDFINAIETSFFNHWFGSTGPLFSRLEQ